MFAYPLLTSTEQAELPALLAPAKAIPGKFEDSTHQLFYCQTAAGEMVLKVCTPDTIAQSRFWRGANHLFAADFPNSLGDMHLTHDFLQDKGLLTVPELVAAGARRFVLSRFIAGTDLVAAHIDDAWVIALARHLAALHHYRHHHWGSLHAPQFSAAAWPVRVHDTLTMLLAQEDTWQTEPIVSAVLSQVHAIEETEFVPMMLDLRWDQFRQTTQHGLALIDLDAFVIGPRALDLLLLEYVLTPAQLAVFKQHYLPIHPWPVLTTQKPCYQLLLFLMHVLGEQDLLAWMQRR